jgi:hypothetical protein
MADDQKLSFTADTEVQPFIESSSAPVVRRNVQKRNIATLPVLRR